MQGHTIDHIFPSEFQKYCKLFNPFFLSPTVNERKRQYWDFEGEKVFSFLNEEDTEHTKALKSYLPRPVSLLAELYNVSFDKNFRTDLVSNTWKTNQPKWLLCPEEGTLDEEIIYELTHVLSSYSDKAECYFHYVPYAIETYEDTVFKGEIHELPDTLNLGLAGSPNHVWPVTKEWFLYTSFDADYTLIGGHSVLIDQILSSPTLEALEVTKGDKF